MRKKVLIILLAVVVVLGVGGYILAQKSVTVKGAITANEILDAKTPAEVKKIIKDNADLIKDLKAKGYITDRDVQKANEALDKMEKEGKPFDKKQIIEENLQGKIPQDQYNKLLDISSQKELSYSDKLELAKILASRK